MRFRGLCTFALLPMAVGSALLAPGSALAAAAAAPRSLYVSTTGNNNNPGTSSRPFATVQKAADVANPGDKILIYSGTYNGVVNINRSGTPSAPITVSPAGTGPVTLASSYSPPPCGATKPNQNRTIRMLTGADYWTISGLNIVGGVNIRGASAASAMHYQSGLVRQGNWTDRRSIPGRGSYDPVAARGAFAELARRTGVTVNPSDGIMLINNTITSRGLQIVAARYGTLAGNVIHAIDCGTGPGVWINVFSDGWWVHHNHVYDVKPSTYKHYMQEGMRFGSASDYNTVEDNLVENLQGDGRAINTDVDASWNLFQRNTARNVNIGFNDQMSGWGNRWLYNKVEGFVTYGFSFRGMDDVLTTPSLHSSTYKAVVTCNRVSGGPTGDPSLLPAALKIGAAKSSTFTNNYFDSVVLGPYVAGYWGNEGDIWNGRHRAPGAHPALPPAGAC